MLARLRVKRPIFSSATRLLPGPSASHWLLTPNDRRELHASASPQSTLVAASLVGMAGALYGGSKIANYIASRPTAPQQPEAGQEPNASEQEAGPKQQASFFASLFARGFYEGGFEDQMTRREAALILGVRETATREKIREAHRRMALLNHPDTGGSPFLAQKINEAKELLLGGRG
jgi:DnaJ family protein C protein 19